MAESDTFYIDVRNEVDQIIDDFGTIYPTRLKGGYDRDEMLTTYEDGDSLVGVVTEGSIMINEYDSSSIKSSETKTIVFKASSKFPENGEVMIDDAYHSLSKFEKIKPADIVVAYILEVGK